MTLGQAIRSARKATGLRLVDVAARVGLDQPGLGRIERDERSPTVAQLASIEDALGVPRGRTLIMAGYVEETPSVPQAIAGDSALNDKGRENLLMAYEAMVHLLAQEGPKGGRR